MLSACNPLLHQTQTHTLPLREISLRIPGPIRQQISPPAIVATKLTQGKHEYLEVQELNQSCTAEVGFHPSQ